MSNLKKNIFFAFGSQGLQLLRSILVSLLIPKTLGIPKIRKQSQWQSQLQ